MGTLGAVFSDDCFGGTLGVALTTGGDLVFGVTLATGGGLIEGVAFGVGVALTTGVAFITGTGLADGAGFSTKVGFTTGVGLGLTNALAFTPVAEFTGATLGAVGSWLEVLGTEEGDDPKKLKKPPGAVFTGSGLVSTLARSLDAEAGADDFTFGLEA